MPTLSGRITRRRLTRAGLIIVVPLAVEKFFEIFISREGLETGKRLQTALIDALAHYNFVGFIGRFFVNFFAVPEVVGDFLSRTFGSGGFTSILLLPTVPIAWVFAFLWTPFDLVFRSGFLTLLIAVVQVAAAWIIIDRSPPVSTEPRKTLMAMVRERAEPMERVTNWVVVYLTLMIFSSILGAALYILVGGGTLIFGWALQLAGLFLFANTIVAFCYLWVMKFAEEKVTDFAKEKIDKAFGDEGEA